MKILNSRLLKPGPTSITLNAERPQQPFHFPPGFFLPDSEELAAEPLSTADFLSEIPELAWTGVVLLDNRKFALLIVGPLHGVAVVGRRELYRLGCRHQFVEQNSERLTRIGLHHEICALCGAEVRYDSGD